MFGYVRIRRDDLKVKDFNTYRRKYCGICKQLGKDYGFVYRAITSYDIVFLALSLENFEEANKFKNELTLRTITSTINDQDRFVEVIYNDVITHDAFTVLLNDFKEAMEKSQVTYQGYRYFAK